MADHMVEASPGRNARIAGAFYLLTFLTGLPAFFMRSGLGVAVGLIAGACYIVVTLLFYYIFRPVNRTLSLLAAVVSLAACASGPVAAGFHFTLQVNPLAVFGFYCLLIGYLIFRSSFLPGILGALMTLEPYNLVPGFIGEGALTVWLLVKGVNEQRWHEQASATGMPMKAAI